MNRQFFKMMLAEMDCEAMMNHSQLNHHVEGMDYLCLHRTPELTVKLYLIDGATNGNSGYLVHPHSHRYAFDSMVLSGALAHIRFDKARGSQWREYEYCAETRSMQTGDGLTLRETKAVYEDGESYFNRTTDIHTLQLIDGGPVLLGLVQYSDSAATSRLYLPEGQSERMRYPNSRRPTLGETRWLQDACASLLF